MPISPENRASFLEASRTAAAALLEDIAHIRKTLEHDDFLAREARSMSGVLRRLLIDNGGDLRKIAPPRIGKFEIDAPDNSQIYQASRKNYFTYFASGGFDYYHNKYRALYSTLPQIALVPHDKTVSLSLDGFLSQKVLALQNEWVTRRQVIKYVANIASGVHSSTPTHADEVLLARIQRAIRLSPAGGSTIKVRFEPQAFLGRMDDFKWTPEAIDPVFIEIASAAHFLCVSPNMLQLEHSIKEELSQFS